MAISFSTEAQSVEANKKTMRFKISDDKPDLMSNRRTRFRSSSRLRTGVHLMINPGSAHTATLLDESGNKHAHRKSVDAVTRRLQHCGEPGWPSTQIALILRAKAPRLKLLAPSFQNHQLGEHLVVLLLRLHRIRTLKP
jgi:hypothetical protein